MDLAGDFEKLLACFGKGVHQFHRDRKRVDLACGVVAGVALPSAVFGFLRISAFGRINPPSVSKIATAVLACLACYLIAAIFVIASRRVTRIVPGWLVIAILGSTLVVLSGGLWSRPDILQSPLPELLVRLRHTSSVVLGVSAFTLPITAAVYYLDLVVRAIEKWHGAHVKHLSILRESDV